MGDYPKKLYMSERMSGNIENQGNIHREKGNFGKQDFTPARQRELKREIENQELPVREHLPELTQAIVESIMRKGILLLQGETGSGKSIYSPIAMRKALRELGLPDRIIMMQPRRDAAKGIARATAAVSGEQLGEGVGYSTSEAKMINFKTAVGIVTPGVFLRYLMDGNINKAQIGAVIIDELHEGNIEYHLALGLLKLMNERGEAPPMLLTSATINKERIQEFFGTDDRDYLRIEGRTYPVVKRYLSEPQPGQEGLWRKNGGYVKVVAEQAVRLFSETTDGDILIFMPGAREIDDTIAHIREEIAKFEKLKSMNLEILPLHGALGPGDRDRALSTNREMRMGRRRIIVTTNIAETSVTVPGVQYVVDSCRQRSVRYNPNTGIIERGTEFISKDQAEQRAGRAGRLGPGNCLRLCTEAEFQKLEEHPDSEIRRTNLSNLVLRIKRMGIVPKSFPFIEPPPPGMIEKGEEELKMLGALDENGKLTAIGEEMADMPFDPRIGRLMVEAKKRNCVEAGLVMAAFSREGSVLLGPRQADIENASGFDLQAKKLTARKKIQELQNKFDRGGSDWLKVLNVFAAAIDQGVFEASLNASTPQGYEARKKFDKWCRENYLKSEALTHIAYKLQEYARYMRLDFNRATLKERLTATKDEDLGCVILAGHPDKLLVGHSSRFRYHYTKLNGQGGEINMSPGSEGFNARYPLCIAAEIKEGSGKSKGIDITRNYADGVHPIGLKELQTVLPHLVTVREDSPEYNVAADEVRMDVHFYPKNSSSELGSESRIISGEKAVSAFAWVLSIRRVDVPWVKYNVEVERELAELSKRAAGEVKEFPDMWEWYKQRLEGASSVKEALALDAKLRLSIDDFCSTELREKIEKNCPKEIPIKGRIILARYRFQSSSPEVADEEYNIHLTLPAEGFFDITEEDIPHLGMDGHIPKVVYGASIGGSYYIEAHTLEELKKKAEAFLIHEAWKKWNKPEPVPFLNSGSIADFEALGYSPISYAKKYNGENVLAYPAVHTVRSYNDSTEEYFEHFKIEYFEDEEKAREANRISGCFKEAALLQAEGQIARKSAEQAILEVGTYRDELRISDTELRTLNEKLVSAMSHIPWPDKHVDENKINSPEGIRIFEEVTETVRLRGEVVEQINKAKKDIESLILQVNQYVDERLDWKNSGKYGISEPEKAALLELWEKGKAFFEGNADYHHPVLPDPEAAKEIFLQLKNNFEGRKEVENYAAQERLMHILAEGKPAMYAVVIRVSGGRVASLRPYLEKEKVINNPQSIQTGSRMLLLDSRVPNRLTLQMASGNMGESITLPDGEYVIERNGNSVVRVREEKDGTFMALELMAWDNQNSRTSEEVLPQYNDPNPLAKSDVLATRLAGLFRGDLSTSKSTPSSPRATSPARPTAPRQVLQVKEIPMTPELAKEYGVTISVYRDIINGVKELGQKPTQPSTKKEIALEALYIRRAELLKECNELEAEVLTTGANQPRLQGKLSALKAAVDSMYKKHAQNAGCDAGWGNKFIDFRNNLEIEIIRDTEVAEYIVNELVEPEKLLVTLREECRIFISIFLSGQTVDIDKIKKELFEKVLVKSM